MSAGTFELAPDSARDASVRAAVAADVAVATNRIAPLWPLRHFVCSNPFLGFTGEPFEATCAMLERVARVTPLMPRAFYRRAAADGTIAAEDVASALDDLSERFGASLDAGEFASRLARERQMESTRPGHVATVAEVLDSLESGNRQRSGTAFMTDEISRFCASYFDEGQAVWRLPQRDLPLYPAWRAHARHDRNPEAMGVSRFRDIVQRMPSDPLDAIAAVVTRQGIPERARADYLYQTLLDVAGWASYARYLRWAAELNGTTSDVLVHLLAIRVVWGYALFLQRSDLAFREAWRAAMAVAACDPRDRALGEDPELMVDLAAHEAYERAVQRGFLERFARRPARTERDGERLQLQAAFCIDVRSEVFRRALEASGKGVRTLGFAGFFGYPIEYVPIGHERGGAQCPVLLRPSFVVRQTVDDASEDENRRILDTRVLRRRLANAWKSFKLSAVSSLVFVESLGLLYAGKMLSDSLGLTRTVADPEVDGLSKRDVARLGPSLAPKIVGGRQTGFTDEQKIDMAARVLTAMSLRANFAPLVLLVGHGSTTVNNPHASSLDCGACGGHTGEANARVAADICNEPVVRQGLRARGIDIPGDTWFAGCLHDTTTDEVRVFDQERVPLSHRARLEAAKALLKEAGAIARRERAPKLGIPVDARTDERVERRSRDWSQVRPEWGLAGNAAFVAAPRALTTEIDFGGRAFLHDYDEALDGDGSVLELILTAPLVVAAWINLQYFASTVDHRVFGAGNKVLHNVCGGLGVLEGNAGDLKTGLPWQSLYDGDRLMHEPVRLSAFVCAQTAAIDAIVARHEPLRNLVEHRWIALFRMDGRGNVTHRYGGGGRWMPAASGSVHAGLSQYHARA